MFHLSKHFELQNCCVGKCHFVHNMYHLISHLSATLLYLSSILLGGGSGGAGLMGLRQGAGAGFGADVGGGDTGETGAWPDPLLWTAKSSGKTGRSF